MKVLALLAFGLQGLAMFVDEFYFHRKRGLPRWERIGHPIDSFSVAICYWFILAKPASQENLFVYVGLCIFSSALVTKDEFVHTKECQSSENWLHAILFVLHPITFFVAGYIWFFTEPSGFLWQAVRVQFALVLFFLIYQITYWNLKWKKR